MKELHAVLLPSGSLHLERREPSAPVAKSTSLLQDEIENRFVEDRGAGLLFLGFSEEAVPLSPSLAFWRRFSGLFAHELVRTPGLDRLRHTVNIVFPDAPCAELLGQIPPMTGSEYLSRDLLAEYWDGLNRAFRTGIRSYPGSAEEFVRTLSPRVHLVGRVFFHLVENKKGPEPFAFLATYSTRLGKGGTEKHLPLKYALQEFHGQQARLLELLATVQTASARSSLIAGLMESGELFHPLAWTPAVAYTFLQEVPVYEESGILCRIPDWWRGSKGAVRLAIRVGNLKPPELGAASLLDFDVALFLGDEEISPEEARRLIEQTEGLAYLKNRWVAVDPERLRRTLEAMEKARGLMDGEGLTLAEAMRLELAPERMLGDRGLEGVEVGVSNGRWLASVIEKMRNPARAARVAPGKDFLAELRGYQQAGLNWLSLLNGLGFGACLADDMGLGKTVQVLAFLDAARCEGKGGPSLLVLPASLISNWVEEIRRFAPRLRVLVAHPAYRTDKAALPQSAEDVEDADLVITTYGLAKRYDWLQAVRWKHLILDEAQAIKNPGAKQSRAVKRLQASNRIILTGTPVENHLGDLWSLFEFLNPGLLGTPREFNRFTQALAKDAAGYGRLRRLVGPYILRRLKTDKAVISDLPDKVEMKTYAELSRKQVLLYQQAVEELKGALSGAEGIRRKGVVLAAITKFKQLCNHPDQYLGSGAFDEEDSGKFLRLREICETVHEKREKLLVFTQFREITTPLAGFLAGVFGHDGLVIHGGVPVGRRREIIDAFQAGDRYIPFMVLSLKTGGLGLNLTEANHVIHFDRWWNPAVENQATDRVFRIGQKRNVIVHKFIVQATVEERIDRMLEEKQTLFEQVVTSTGETWITEMSDKELMDLFTLRL